MESYLFVLLNAKEYFLHYPKDERFLIQRRIDGLYRHHLTNHYSYGKKAIQARAYEIKPSELEPLIPFVVIHWAEEWTQARFSPVKTNSCSGIRPRR